MGLLNTLRKFCIMKNVRDEAKEEFNPNDKYEKLKYDYLEISIYRPPNINESKFE